jgi:two-component system OmpR family sensor kinase
VGRLAGVSMRWKILGSIVLPVFVLIVILTTAISTLVLADNARQVDDHLAREAQELSLLSERAYDARTGQPLSSPKALLELYITRTIPDPNETMFVLEDGVVFARTTDTPPVRLDRDANFLALVNQTSAATFGNWNTEVGNARYVVVPVQADGSTGALVAIIFSDLNAAPMRDLLLRFALIGLFALVGMVALGYLAAGRIFRPIQKLTEFASEVGEDRLQHRLEVVDSNNELDRLGIEFNTMLDRLEESFKSQKQFVDIAGHELRTPLTVIRGHFDLVKANPAEAEQSLPIIEDELERMSRLVQDLQTLTKASAPEFVRPETAELRPLAADLKAKIASLTRRKVEVIGADGSWEIDPQRISQAVLQLVENALKYTPAKAKIKVSLQVLGSQLQVVVEDGGTGIPLDQREAIFEPFVRGKGMQNVEGSGIGLSLVRAIAQAHGGEVSIGESELGGARFVLRIPR